jgi:hypothetical protein
MAIAKVQDVYRDGFQNLTSATSGTLGATPTSGNLLWALFFTDSQPHTITHPSGWTALPQLNYSPGSYSVVVAYKVAGGAEPTSYTWTWTTNTSVTTIYLSEWTGTDTTTPIDANDSAWTDFGFNPSSPLAIPSITTVTNGAVHIIALNNQHQNQGYTAPTGYVSETGNVAAWVAFSKTISTAGATGTVNVTSALFWYESFSFAMRPTSGAPPVFVPYQTYMVGILTQ